MSNAVKVCVHCRHAVEVELPQGAIPLLTAKKMRQCVFNPPTPILVAMHSGGVAITPMHPPVDENTVSRAQFDNIKG